MPIKLFDHNTDAVRIANGTARSGGASALDKNGNPSAIVPKFVEQHVNRNSSILDFGSGPKAIHTKYLQDKGFKDVTAYDYGSNVTEFHDANALMNSYDVVFASNVLNVQVDETELQETLTEIYNATKPGGTVYFNYPTSPRKAGFSVSDVIEKIVEIFGVEPERVGGTQSAPLWKIRK